MMILDVAYFLSYPVDICSRMILKIFIHHIVENNKQRVYKKQLNSFSATRNDFGVTVSTSLFEDHRVIETKEYCKSQFS